ncbi:fimbrial biogenesis chaperone [Ewingella americana]
MRNTVNFLIKGLTLLLITTQISHAGGIVIGQTRVIYDADKKEAALSITNNSESNPFLIQSWVDTGESKTHGPFVVTPPLFRINPQEEHTLRISYTDAQLPKDKESLFYINVRAIPSSKKGSTNELKLVVKTRLKLFYRPKGLAGSAAEAYKLLTFTRSGGQLHIHNPTSFYVTFSSLKAGNSVLSQVEMIAPQSAIDIPLDRNNSGNTVRWSAITDYGGGNVVQQRTL